MNTSIEKVDISAVQFGISVGETVKPIQLMGRHLDRKIWPEGVI